MKSIFVVDDNTVNLMTAEDALSAKYDVTTLSSAVVMFEFLDRIIPDLILLDIMMPEIDGFEAIKRLKADERYAGIPVIFLSGRHDTNTEALGFEKGAVDFITKPFTAPVLLNRIKLHLHVEDIIRERTEMLQQRTEMLQQRTDKLQKLQSSLISVLANIVENRDRQTDRHIERTTRYIRILLDAIIKRGLYSDEMKKWNIEIVVSSSRLHDVGEIIALHEKDPDHLEIVISSSRLYDIGKSAVADMILNKPGSLSTEEYETIKAHAEEGEKIINSIIAESGDEAFLQNAKLFAGSHHERWDGAGYPRGLKGEDIPLQGRIMAIADVYDALISERPYKKAMTHDDAAEIIREGSGSHFDPQIVDVFLEVGDLFAETDQTSDN